MLLEETVSSSRAFQHAIALHAQSVKEKNFCGARRTIWKVDSEGKVMYIEIREWTSARLKR